MPDRPRRPHAPSGPPLGGDREIVYRKRPSWVRRNLAPVVTVLVVLLVVGGAVAAVLVTRDSGSTDSGNVADGLLSSAVPSPSASASASPSASAASSTTPAAAGADRQTATGTVTAVLGPGQWTVAVQKDLDITVVATGATNYVKAKGPGDIKKGVSITAIGTITAGVLTAKSVTVEKKSSA